MPQEPPAPGARNEPEAEMLFWTEVSTVEESLGRTTLHRGTLDRSGGAVVSGGSVPVPGDTGSVAGLTTDARTATLYGTIAQSQQIWRIAHAAAPEFERCAIEFLDVSFPEKSEPEHDFHGIAHDPSGRRLYIAETNAHRIWTILLGAKRLHAVPFAAAASPSALAIDAKAGRLYWGVHDDPKPFPPYRSVQKARLVGAHEDVELVCEPQTVASVRSDERRPVNAVAVGAKRKVVYFTEVGRAALQRVEMLPGAKVRPALAHAAASPVGLCFDPVRKRLFWGSEDAGSSRVWTASIDNLGVVGQPTALVTPGPGRTIGQVAFLRVGTG